MRYRYALNTAGAIFLLVAVLHLLRVTFTVPVILGTWIVPLWISSVGFLAALGLSGWMFLSCRD